MTSFTNQQLQSLIAQLDQSIYSHDQWYKNLLRILITHLPPETADLLPDAHRHCRFGQWYENYQSSFIKENPLFISLGDAHEKMHLGATKLLRRVSAGLPISPNEWDHFDNLLDRVRLEFQALRQEFATAAQNRDPLTEAQTRGTMLSELREQDALAKRGRQECALIMFDLDHFKRVNDAFGHAAGDLVLVSVVKCVKALLRPYDKIYRYGGEEFLICMPSANLEEATQVAERMRSAIARQSMRYNQAAEPLQVTASFGVAALSSHRTIDESLACVDRAMYSAKAAGRNCVIVNG
jgi:diguanylate cyclase